MRKLILTMVATAGFLAAVAPLTVNASEHLNCNSVPKSEWAKCVLDQAGESQ